MVKPSGAPGRVEYKDVAAAIEAAHISEIVVGLGKKRPELRSEDEIHDECMRDPAYRREYERTRNTSNAEIAALVQNHLMGGEPA